MCNQARKKDIEDLMSLPNPVAAVIVALLLHSSQMYAADQASCVFDTFSAPEGYSFSQVNGVSDDGTVVGQLVNDTTQAFVAFTRSPEGQITEYGAPKALTTWLYGYSGTGIQNGFYQDIGYPQHVHGFLLKDGVQTTVNYPKAANTWLFEMNQLGEAVGSYTASPALIKGFELVNGKYTTIAYPEALATYAMAINDNGEIVGTYSSTPISNGFVWEHGTFTTLNFPNAKYGTVLTGVNNSGVIVGNRITSDSDFGFIYENGVFKNIVYPGARSAMTGGINNNGVISGQIYLTSQSYLGYTATCK
jgi:hypothetical protein